jgi:hypothetical protein
LNTRNLNVRHIVISFRRSLRLARSLTYMRSAA